MTSGRLQLHELVRLVTREDRRKYARFCAYDLAARFGADVPPQHLPPQDREERAAIVAGLKFRYGSGG